MPVPAKILLPVDFSERSIGAARYGKTLAAHFHSQLTLLHVLPPLRYEFGAMEVGGSMLGELYVNRAEQVRKELDGFLAQELSGLAVERVVLEGDPARRIVAYAQEHHSDVLIMPTHGYGPFRRFILGSITAKVLHDADCPVWTGVHMEEAPPLPDIPLRQILCAVDLGPQSCKAIQWAMDLQAAFGARLSVLHVNTCTRSPNGEYSDTEWRRESELAVRDELQHLEDRTGAKADMLIETGDPPHLVCAAAQRLGADLLVIGRGSARGVFGRLRTNAYAIIRGSPCPVVSV